MVTGESGIERICLEETTFDAIDYYWLEFSRRANDFELCKGASKIEAEFAIFRYTGRSCYKTRFREGQ